MKRSPLKRKGGLSSRGRRKSHAPQHERAAFWEAALAQRCCQNPECSAIGTFDPHHVLPRQSLARLGLPQYDPRNALRVCRDCHSAHEYGGKRLSYRWLTAANISYVSLTLGDAALDFFRRFYADAP